MEGHLFWFSDSQWSQIEPHLPTNQQGPKREDDRRILSGIMHVIKTGCRWCDCPAAYGPAKTVYNRFARWSERGIWQRIFEEIAPPAPPDEASLDSTHIKTHRCAGGGKGGAWRKRSARQKADAIQSCTQWLTSNAARTC